MNNDESPKPKIFKTGNTEYSLPAGFNIEKYVYSAFEALTDQHLWMPESERRDIARCIIGCAIEDVLKEYLKYVPRLLTSDDPELAEARKRIISSDGTLDFRRLLEMDLEENHLDQRIGGSLGIDLAKAETLCGTYHRAKSRAFSYKIHRTPNGSIIYLSPETHNLLGPYLDGARNALRQRHHQIGEEDVERYSCCIVGCTLKMVQERIIKQYEEQILIAQTPGFKELRLKLSESSGMPMLEKLGTVYIDVRELNETFGDKNCIDLGETGDKCCVDYNSWRTRLQDLIGKPHLHEFSPLKTTSKG